MHGRRSLFAGAAGVPGLRELRFAVPQLHQLLSVGELEQLFGPGKLFSQPDWHSELWELRLSGAYLQLELLVGVLERLRRPLQM